MCGRRCVNPAAKKAVFYLAMAARLAPSTLLFAVSVSSKLPHLPSMAEGCVNELHQLYFASSHGKMTVTARITMTLLILLSQSVRGL